MSYDPTPSMVERCQAWLKVVDTLEKYLNAASVRYDWINEATKRLSTDMPQPEDLGEQFAAIGKGGIKDVFVKLWWDLNLPDGKAADSASKIIKEELLIEVESLKGDLNRSISDFSDHSASFDNTLAPSKTASMRDPSLHSKIDEYQRAVSAAEAGKQPEIDPYLLKLNLDRRIDRAVRKHNNQADAYAYVQDAAKRVDSEVTQRLQTILKRYTEIVERNGNIIAGGGRAIRSVFVNQPQLFEYKHWLQSSKAPATFVGQHGEVSKKRESDSDLGYPKEDSVYAKAVRTGSLERRSKILRTYSPGDYVLTPQSLIELRQNHPVWSIDLMGAKLLENDKAATEDQFVIEAKQHGSSSGKPHKFVFRAKVASNWKRDLASICAGKVPTSLASLVKAQNSDVHVYSEPGHQHHPSDSAPSYTSGNKDALTSKNVSFPEGVNEGPASATVTGVAAPGVAATGTKAVVTEPAAKPYAGDISAQTSGLSLNDRKFPDSTFADKVSVADSNKAAIGVPPPSNIPTPSSNLSTVTASETPNIATNNALGDASDSEVSEVEQSYDGLSDDEETNLKEDSLAYRAKKDIAVFGHPVGEKGPDAKDDSSVWSYDAKHNDGLDTLKKDNSFRPAESHLPVEAERSLSQTSHKFEKPEGPTTRDSLDANQSNKEVLNRRRRSSAAAEQPDRRASRKATGSFGAADAPDLKPLGGLTQEDKTKAGASPVFSEDLPPSTTGKPN